MWLNDPKPDNATIINSPPSKGHLNSSFIHKTSPPTCFFIHEFSLPRNALTYYYQSTSSTRSRNHGRDDRRRRRRDRRTSRLSPRDLVLGDAPLHPLVDNGNSTHICTRPMPDRDALPTLLQLPSCLRQESGSYAPQFHQLMPLIPITVLASPHHIPLFRPAVS
jgi:hypothetical protein